MTKETEIIVIFIIVIVLLIFVLAMGGAIVGLLEVRKMQKERGFGLWQEAGRAGREKKGN